MFYCERSISQRNNLDLPIAYTAADHCIWLPRETTEKKQFKKTKRLCS